MADKITALIDQQMMLEHFWKTLVQTQNITDSRERRNVIYRQAFLVSARNLSNLSLSSIGKIVGKHHATVVHSCKCHDMNYKFDRVYRDVFDSMITQMSKELDNHTENMEQIVSERLSRINVDVYENSLIDLYKRKLERAEKRYEEQMDAIKRDLTIVTKQMKRHKKRAENLDYECRRLKNLL